MTQEVSIEEIISQQVPVETWEWLESRAVLVKEEKGSAELNKAFAFIPRKTGTNVLIQIPATVSDHAPTVDTWPPATVGLIPRDWTIDRLCRVWLLRQVRSDDQPAYVTKIENLFSGSSMNEQVALYSALPVLSFPAEWRQRCAEGIRSNIGTVLEAIMYGNGYPDQFLDEAAWNQLVLKAFFTEKDITRIIGIDRRANSALAGVLFDYAHERWAAGRTVNTQLWRLTGPFLDAGNFADIQKLWQTGTAAARSAALLACAQSDYPPAQRLLESEPELKKAIAEGRLSWNNLAG